MHIFCTREQDSNQKNRWKKINILKFYFGRKKIVWDGSVSRGHVSTTFFFFSSSSFFLSTLRNKQPWHWVNDFTFPLRLNPFLHFSICLFCLFVFSFFSLLIFLCFVCLSSYLFSMSWSIFLRTSVALVLIQTCHKTKISILLKSKNEKK